MVGSAVSQAFYQRAADTYNRAGDLRDLYKQLAKRLFFFALPAFFMLVLFAPTIFRFVFGDTWQQAGHYARILAPYILLRFIAAPVSFIPLVINEQKKALFITMGGNFMILFSIFYGGYVAHDLTKGLQLLTVLLSIYFCAFFYWIYCITGVRKRAY